MVTMLLGIVVVLSVQWVSGLIGVSNSQIDQSSPQRDAAFIVDRVRLDLSRATTCDPAGMGGPLHEITPSSVAVHVDDDDDGVVDLIRWRLQDTSLQRSVVTGDGTCDFSGTTPAWQTVTEHVRADATTFITGYRGHERADDLAADYGSCTGADVDRCLYDGIDIDFILESPDTERPLVVEQFIPVSLADSKLVVADERGAVTSGAVEAPPVTDPPPAPSSPVARAGDKQATVAWPFTSGALSYTVTASPGGQTAVVTRSPAVVTGLSNGTSYTFTVTATNEYGHSDPSAASNAVTPYTKPGVPTGLSVTPNDTALQVSWTAPTQTAATPVTGYRIFVNSFYVGQTAAGNTTYTAAGLTNGTDYSITVAAFNDSGQSPLTAPVVGKPYGVPFAPTIGTATRGDAQATVTFTAPTNDNGNPITAYLVTSSPHGVTATGTSSPITVTGLTNGIDYTFTVQAINAAGPGAASAPSNSVRPITIPATPGALAATPGDTQVALTWNAVPSTNAAPVTGYRVFRNGTQVQQLTGTNWTNTGLTNGTTYSFQVAAYGPAGQSPLSGTVASKPRTIPGAPTLSTISFDDAELTVTYSPPASNGGDPITSYRTLCETTANGAVASRTATSTSTSTMTVTGLTNGAAYDCRVQATNAAGWGPYSATLTETPRTVPYAPTGLTATAGNAQVVLSWNVVVPTDARPVTGYRVYRGGVMVHQTTSTGWTNTGLVNGTTYSYQVATYGSGGEGPMTAAVLAKPRTTPGAPTNVTAALGADGLSAVVSFTPPASNGGETITSYEVSYTNPAVNETQTQSFAATGTGRTGTIQTWTVPHTGTFRITGIGAQGGNAMNGGTAQGGRGAQMAGDFNLTAGQQLKILVGQQATTNASVAAAPGGGGTFITTSTNSPLVVAGGGSGGYLSTPGPNALTTNNGTTNGGTNQASGAGLVGNGQGDSWTTAAASFVNGGLGVVGAYGQESGFGGGAGTHGNHGTGHPGGGGYNGGNSGNNASTAAGSFNGGTNQSNAVGTGTGNGAATISWTVNLPATTTTITGTGSPITVPDLVDAKSYTFNVRAINVVGAGPSAASNSLTMAVAYGTQSYANSSTGQSGTIRTWTAPHTGTFKIRAVGAGGGLATYYNPSYPGRGAQVAGEVYLTKGTQLKVLVGQQGGNGFYTGGGGGGTYVTTSANSPVIVAGGGAGAFQSSNYQTSYSDASTATSGRPWTNSAIYGGGGGGLTGDGADYAANSGGHSFTNGGLGGALYDANGGSGGFGGGGSGYSSNASGGGGGYSGGNNGTSGGGGTAGYQASGGGGSFVPSGGTSATGVNAGHGSVKISWGTPPPPPPGSQTLNATSSGASGTVQTWVAPYTATYRFDVMGAQGGSAYLMSTTTLNPGGLGARIQGNVFLEEGTAVSILVGQQGGNAANMGQRGGGGGGGTYIYQASSLLFAAGGGGGAGQYATTSKHGTAGAGGQAGTTNGAVGGSNGNGGSASTYGGGGAGWLTNGVTASYGGGGLTPLNGGTGGAVYSDGGTGGFGGGGGSYAGSGGGGGYSGGGGGGWSYAGDGGGGGSFNSGTNQASTNAHRAGHGQVVITWPAP